MKSLMWVLATVFVAVINMQSVRAESFELDYTVTCGLTDNVTANLQSEFGETMFLINESFNEHNEPIYSSLWINHETKTWTFLVSNEPRGISCIMGSGENMNVVLPKVGDPT